MPEEDHRAPSRNVSVAVTEGPIDLSQCESLATPYDGALVIFCGVVRGESEGRSVRGLSYESYNHMAERQMRDIAHAAQAEYGANAVRLVHRTGDLQIGEVSVLAAVSAPHRDAAFGACRFCIDAIKQKAAIWKKETFFDGESRWVDGA